MLGKTAQHEKRTKNNQYCDWQRQIANPPKIKNILKAKRKYFYTNKLENLQQIPCENSAYWNLQKETENKK